MEREAVPCNNMQQRREGLQDSGEPAMFYLQDDSTLQVS